MPYADRWGIIITKVEPSVYDVARNERTVRVRIDQEFADETLNEAAALFRAIERFDDQLSDAWRQRLEYAKCRWKIRAYQFLIEDMNAQINAARPRDRAPLVAIRDKLVLKRTRWVNEEERLRTLLGSDA